ncbi:MAG TPA: hypothetical protein VLE89_04705 [Chlamydiales bacterium]|nr:hypothetical protein [Chlamydiales bacterium]
MTTAAVTRAGGVPQPLAQDPFAGFAARCADLDEKLEAFRNKISNTPQSERRKLASEFNEFQFAQMDLEDIIADPYFNTRPESKILVDGIKHKIDQLGKFIAGGLPTGKDDTLKIIISSATLGVLAGIGSLIGKSSTRGLNAKPQTPSTSDPAPSVEPVLSEIFDRISVHHNVGTREQFIIKSNVYLVQPNGTRPLRMLDPILHVSQDLQKDLAIINGTGLDSSLREKGLEFASARITNPRANVVLCKHSIKSSDLEAQRNKLGEAMRAYQEAEQARSIAQENTKRAFANVGDHVDISVIPPGVGIKDPVSGVLYDVPNLVQAKFAEERANSMFNQAVQQYGIEATKYSGMQRDYNRDHGNQGWFEIFLDFSKKSFGFLFNLVSQDF